MGFHYFKVVISVGIPMSWVQSANEKEKKDYFNISDGFNDAAHAARDYKMVQIQRGVLYSSLWPVHTRISPLIG